MLLLFQLNFCKVFGSYLCVMAYGRKKKKTKKHTLYSQEAPRLLENTDAISSNGRNTKYDDSDD